MPTYSPQFLAIVKKMLQRAQGGIMRPGGWTQGRHARNEDGKPVFLMEGGATAWTPNGAIWQAITNGVSNDEWGWANRDKRRPVGNEAKDHIGNTCLDFLRAVTDTDNLTRWNNASERTQADVVRAFGDAIDAVAEAEQAARVKAA